MSSRRNIVVACVVFGIGVGLLLVFKWPSTPGPGLSVVKETPARSDLGLQEGVEGVDGGFDERREQLQKQFPDDPTSHEDISEENSSEWLACKPAPQDIDPDILRALVFSPWLVTVGGIVHSPTFNPRKVPIPDSSYRPLRALLSHFVDHFHEINQYKGHVRHSEIRALDEAGELLEAPTKQQLQEKVAELAALDLKNRSHPFEQKLLEEIESRIWARVRRDGPISVGYVAHKHGNNPIKYYPSDKLTNSIRVRDYGRFRGQELAYFLIEYFHVTGYIASDEKAKCLTHVEFLLKTYS